MLLLISVQVRTRFGVPSLWVYSAYLDPVLILYWTGVFVGWIHVENTCEASFRAVLPGIVIIILMEIYFDKVLPSTE